MLLAGSVNENSSWPADVSGKKKAKRIYLICIIINLKRQ